MSGWTRCSSGRKEDGGAGTTRELGGSKEERETRGKKENKYREAQMLYTDAVPGGSNQRV